MAWDATAKKVAVKAIGQVESSLNYAAINYNDPITVGMAQWYGTRAAAILNRMRAAHPTEYARVDAGLRSRLETVSEGSSSWNTYYLSRQAGDSLRDLLLASKDIQGDQIVKDLESYFSVAKQYGINPETDTDAFILWCVAYHQGPRYALQAANNYSGGGLNAMYNAIMSNGVLGQYYNRYNGAKNIIANKDTSGVDVGASGVSTPGNGGSVGENNQQVSIEGGKVVITADDSNILTMRSKFGTHRLYSRGHNLWEVNIGEIVQNITGGQAGAPNQGGGGGGGAVPSDGSNGAKALAWILARLGKFAYCQCPGRQDPDHSGITDCSGLMYAAYKATSGTFVGTWTGDQYFRGQAVIERGSGAMTAAQKALLRPGDMIVMAWRSTGSVYPETDHVEMVVDQNTTVGHGGNPYYGPVKKSIDILSATRWWTVRRH
nr:MAG TPA: type VI secretion exported 1 [Caudoviricetes sp.]